MKIIKRLSLFLLILLLALSQSAFTNSGDIIRSRGWVSPLFVGDSTYLDPDVAHGMTTLVRTDAYGLMKILHATNGGFRIIGLSDNAGATGLQLEGFISVADPTDTTPAAIINCGKLSGTTIGAIGDAETCYQLQNNGTALVTILGNGSVGIGTTVPQSLLDVQGPVGTGAGSAGILTLATKELTIVDDDQLGRINFNAPLESDGSDAILAGAAIWAEAEATFSAAVNNTALVFGTATTSAAIERMRIDASGNVGIGTATATSLLTVGATDFTPNAAIKLTLSTTAEADLGFLTTSTQAGARNWLVGSNYHAWTDFVIRKSNAKGGDPYSAGTTIFIIDSNNNVGLNTTSFGTTLANGLAMGNGTAATAALTNGFMVWSADFLGGAGDARMHIMGEGSAAALTILGSGKVTVQGTTGGVTKQIAEATATLSGASTTIQTNVTSGSRIIAVQLRVDTTITSGDGATSWTAAFVNVPTTAITSGQAFAQNTKFSKMTADEIATGEVDITITPNANTFSGGVIRAIITYELYDAMASL